MTTSLTVKRSEDEPVSYISKAKMEKLREEMVREDVSTVNDLLRFLRKCGLLDFEGDDDILFDPRVT